MTFSLLMPSYNQACFIGEAVQSVLDQKDADWELLILDNSTDGTPDVMAKFIDPRIKFHHKSERMDVGTCLNWMLERAQGPYFSYIHTDNLLLPCFVGDHKKALAAHPLAVVACDYWEISEDGRRQKLRRRPHPFPLGRLFSTDSIGVPFAATLELARRLGGFSCDDLADDVLFVLRADALGPRIQLRKPQMEYRVHAASRFLSGGPMRVFRAIHKSVVQAYAERPQELPNPFQGGLEMAQSHVARASRMALSQASTIAYGDGPIWVLGIGPSAFWMAWALGELGHPIAGFVAADVSAFLNLQVVPKAPEGTLVLDPRSRGWSGLHQGLRWALRGLPPQDHTLKRLPGDIMAALLVPFQVQTPNATAVWIQGKGPLAAYLAFAAEYLGGISVRGFVGDSSPWPGLPAVNSTDEVVWRLGP